MSTLLRSSIVFGAIVVLNQGGTGHAQAFASADAARQLVYALERMGLNSIAAVDPTTSDTFVAALYIPRSQLLVVSARHPSIEGVVHRIAMRQYREVYLDLQTSPTPKDKFFLQDAGADGLLSARPGSGDVDVLYEDGVRQTLFNGAADGLSRAEYERKLVLADAHYARLLKLLTSSFDQGTEVPKTSTD
jgi:hypothetical protein